MFAFLPSRSTKLAPPVQTAHTQPHEKEAGNLRLFSLTWPIFLGLFLFTLIGITDTFMLSGVSDQAVAAVGAANQFVFIAILILEVIGTPTCAKFAGSGFRPRLNS